MTDVAGLEDAWRTVDAVMPEGWIGPTLDYGDGEWEADAFPGIDSDGNVPDPVEGHGDTPTAALRSLGEQLERNR